MLINTSVIDSRTAHRAAEVLDVGPVDLKHLRRYTFGDVKLEKEVLDLFFGQLPQTIASLRDAATERDWMIAAHTLKGSARAVGAWRIGRLAEHAERNLPIANEVVRAQAIARIEEASEEARGFIETAYPDA